jgi:AcrR family transcriptional regulator
MPFSTHAWEEVAALGYGQVTMAGVAARAGTNKATLWSSFRSPRHEAADLLHRGADLV